MYTVNTTLRYLFLCGTCLITDRGVLTLPPRGSQRHYIFASKPWVQEDEIILFLHPDYERSLVFMSGDTMVSKKGSQSSVLQFGHPPSL